MTRPAPECTALAEELRGMRARTGLSLAGLSERTLYSKSSWERYLNGKKLPPRQAVEELCALAGEPAGRLLALWELAEAAWSGRASHAPPADPPADPPAPAAPADDTVTRAKEGGRGTRSRRLSALGAGVAALAAAAVIAALSLHGSGTGQPTSLGSPASPASPALDPPAGCRGRTCEGKDPEYMACASADRSKRFRKHRTRTGAFVQIRYSEACAAAWGRFWHTRIGDEIEISAAGGPPQRKRIDNAAAAGDYAYTPMVDGGDPAQVKVCFVPVGVGETECFRAS